MLEKYEICCGLFHGFDWSLWIVGNRTDQIRLLPAAQEHILAQENGKSRLCWKRLPRSLKRLRWLFHIRKTTEIRDNVAFFQAVRSVLVKPSATEGAQSEATEQAI